MGWTSLASTIRPPGCLEGCAGKVRKSFLQEYVQGLISDVCPGTTMSSDAMLVFAAWLRWSGRSRQPLMILPNQLPAWECWGLETAPGAPWELSLPGQLQASSLEWAVQNPRSPGESRAAWQDKEGMGTPAPLAGPLLTPQERRPGPDTSGQADRVPTPLPGPRHPQYRFLQPLLGTQSISSLQHRPRASGSWL